jgi:diguanylate cyclase (GGDEF)-like protein
MVNDTLGHSAGDKLLHELAQRMTRVLPETSTIARVGGDEFNILMEDLDSVEELHEFATRLRSNVRHVVHLKGIPFRPEVSVGCSVYPDTAREKQSLVQQADIAMYNAKHSALNKVHLYEARSDHLSSRYSLELELGRALEEDQFELYFQPMIDLQQRRTIGMEALLRWNHPVKGMILPGQFIETLEHTGYIREVGEWVLEEVCDKIKSFDAEEAGLRVAVNFSARQLFSPDLRTVMRDTLRRKNVPPGCIGIEITENSAMQELETASQTLREFSAMGIWTILDDFGKGYSSLNLLKRLPVDVVKIDKSFVQSLPGSSEDATMVSSIISLVNNMGKCVVAEGIERQEQADYLTRLGCVLGQGFYFGYPAPFEKAMARIDRV